MPTKAKRGGGKKKVGRPPLKSGKRRRRNPATAYKKKPSRKNINAAIDDRIRMSNGEGGVGQNFGGMSPTPSYGGFSQQHSSTSSFPSAYRFN